MKASRTGQFAASRQPKIDVDDATGRHRPFAPHSRIAIDSSQ